MEKSYQKAQFEYRRADTRRKIEWGGLIVKADLEAEPKDIILGGLLSLKESLNDPGMRTLFQSKGMQAFLKS